MKCFLKVSVLLLILGWLNVGLVFAKSDQKFFFGKTYYTKVNIWHENSVRIASTNFHWGTMIPVGSKVTISDISLGSYCRISFNVQSEKKDFYIVRVPEYTATPIEELFNQYFSLADPLASGGEFEKFTPQEQEAIKKGVVDAGMSKDAVIMAYGYPPTHKTPSLSNNSWLYWVARRGLLLVKFADNKVVSLKHGSSFNVYDED